MAEGWSVLIFGDSWADYMHPTWPQALGRRLSARVHNFATAGSTCSDLANQGRRALASMQVPKTPEGLLRQETLVVVHTGGNDFIMKCAEVLMGGGGVRGAGSITPEILSANPGAREANMMSEFLNNMYKGGARHVLVSGVPAFLEMPIFNMLWPVITVMVNEGRLESIGVSPGDPPQLAMQVQAVALYDRWVEVVEKFSKEHPDVTCALFDEVGALERLRETMGSQIFDRSMWDMTMFHPSIFGHEQLASEAHICVSERFSELAQIAPHPEVTMAATSEEKTEPPAEPAAEPLTLRIRNVKGNVAFATTCDAQWSFARLREAILLAAPSGFAEPGCTLDLAFKGRLLGQGTETLRELGLSEGTQIIAVAKKPAAVNP